MHVFLTTYLNFAFITKFSIPYRQAINVEIVMKPNQSTRHSYSLFNPFKPSDVKWLHFRVFRATLV